MHTSILQLLPLDGTKESFRNPALSKKKKKNLDGAVKKKSVGGAVEERRLSRPAEVER